MFFYISLFIASIITAFVVLYLFNLLVSVGKINSKILAAKCQGQPNQHVGGVPLRYRSRYFHAMGMERACNAFQRSPQTPGETACENSMGLAGWRRFGS